MTDFEKTSKQEKNENTALILMLGEISAKLSRIIELLKKSKEAEDEKFYLPITTADYD
jgi:hypothetical protein